MTTATQMSEKLQKYVETVEPGKPFRLTAAHSPGDLCWQGDLGIEVVAEDCMPDGYEEVTKPKDADRQLVPESGQGSHHRLQSFDGVTLFRPKNWGSSAADLRGPLIRFSKPNAIVHEPGHAHPHGTVLINAPMTVLCRYQRNIDVEQRVVRAMD